MAQQYVLPDWARLYGQQVDLRTSPFWGPQDNGDGSGTLGNGDGSGFYGPLSRFAGQQVGNGDGQYGTAPDITGATDWLSGTGQQVMQAYGDGQVARWLQDAQGNITAEPEINRNEDDNFWTAAMLAAAVTGANLYGSAGGAGAVAEGGAAAAPEVAAAGATSYAPATNAALAESAVGTAGYGASSAGAGGGAGQLSSGLLGGVFDGVDMGKIGSGLLDYAAKNPKVVGSLAGGLLGATGGLESGGGGAAHYTGPMPTISRGNWQPRAQAQMMALPQFQAPQVTQGAQGSGLWRFMGGK